jgi:malate/lactate dehydrogenase
MKISIIGAGRVGATAAFALVGRRLVDELALVDIRKDLAEGEAMDIFHGTSTVGKAVEVSGSDDYAITQDSDLVIITAGIARRPGQSRLDLAETNAGIMKGIVDGLKEYNDDPLLFVVANPVDVLTNVAFRTSGFAPERVFGLGTLLDTIRLRSHLRRMYGEKAKGIEAMIIGEHGDTMLPVFRGYESTSITLSELEGVFMEIRDAAIRVIELKGATFYAPAVAIAEAAESIILDREKALPLTVYLEEHDFCIGHPAVAGRDGVRPVDFEPTGKEKQRFERSLSILKGVLEKVL